MKKSSKINKKESRKGVVGRRIKIQPFENEGMLSSGSMILGKAKVISAGNKSHCRAGDIIIYNAYFADEVEIDGIKSYYILDTDDFIYEILP